MQHHRALVRTSASWSQFLFRLSNQIASNSRLSTQSRSLIIGSRSMGSNHLNLSGSAYNSIFSTSVRSYSSGEGQSYTRVVREDFVPTLMQMPLLTIPNPIAVVWNWIYFKYRMPEMDPTFEIHAFLTGAKKAIAVVSEMIAMDDMEGVRNLLTEEAFAELSENLKSFTDKQKQRVKVTEEEITLQYIGLMKDYEVGGKRYVEVSVVAHVMQELKSAPNFPVAFNTTAPKLVANYRFRRQVLPNANEESDWKIVRFNHFYSILPKFLIQNSKN